MNDDKQTNVIVFKLPAKKPSAKITHEREEQITNITGRKFLDKAKAREQNAREALQLLLDYTTYRTKRDISIIKGIVCRHCGVDDFNELGSHHLAAAVINFLKLLGGLPAQKEARTQSGDPRIAQRCDKNTLKFFRDRYGEEPPKGYKEWQFFLADIALDDEGIDSEIDIDKAEAYAKKHDELILYYEDKLFSHVPDDRYYEWHVSDVVDAVMRALPMPSLRKIH